MDENEKTGESKSNNQNQLKFVQSVLSKYYSLDKNRKRIFIPNIENREFGAGIEKKIDFRHRSFSSNFEFYEFLTRTAPLYVSYSTAIYRFPSANPMEKKERLATNLVFDLDNTYESENHLEETHNDIICQYCLKRATEDANRFVKEFVLDDFGFSRQDININFSGSKGYHIHIRNESVSQLSSDSRKQLCDYAAGFQIRPFDETGNGGILIKNYQSNKRSYTVNGPKEGDFGWKKKVLSWTIDFIEKSQDKDLKEMGITRPIKIKQFMEKKGEIIKAIKNGLWEYLDIDKNFFENCVQRAISNIRVETDKPVSFDLARLIRVPNSIHGTTGLVAIEVQDLEKFEPLKDAIAFEGKGCRIYTLESIKLKMNEREFVLEKFKEESVPDYLAVLLVLKGKARILDEV